MDSTYEFGGGQNIQPIALWVLDKSQEYPNVYWILSTKHSILMFNK